MQTAEEFLEDQFGKGNWVTMDAVTIKARDAQVREAALREASEMICQLPYTMKDSRTLRTRGIFGAEMRHKCANAILALIENKEGE